MTDREAMQQALEALELLARYENPATKVQVRKPRNGGSIVTIYPHKVATEAAAPLRERLAQPEQEPVAWILEWVEDGEVYASKLYESERRCRYDAKKDTNAVCRTLVYGDKLKEKNNG